MVVTFLCLLGTAVCLALFQADLNRSFRRLNEDPMGSIAFTSRAALRRFQDRIVWDRLRRESPVYNGDFIRTAEHSEAAVRFSGGELVSLSENSLIRIFVEEGKTRIDFSRGTISAYTGEKGGLSISFRGNRVDISSGAALSLDTTEGEENVRVRAMEGNISIITPEETVEASAGTVFTLGPQGIPAGGSGFAKPSVFLAQTRFLAPVNASAPVEFILGAFPEGAAGVLIEIAGDRNFTRPLTVLEKTPGTDSAGVTAELPAGSWWWRAYSEGEEPGGAEEKGQFTVIQTLPPQPVSPAPASVHRYQTELPALRFQWTSLEGVQHYILEAADNPGMANPALREEVRSNSLVYSRLGEGRWYWRVTPVFPAFYKGSVPASPVVPFTVSRGQSPIRTETPAVTTVEIPPVTPAKVTPPVTVPAASRPSRFPAVAGRIPANGYVITPDTLRTSRTVTFSWNPVAGADGYIFSLLSENASGARQSIMSAESSTPSYTLADLTLLDQGTFIWQVEAVGGGTPGRRGTTGENQFTVDIPKPEAPRGRDAGVLYGR
jgi:hypothetical protein